MDAFRLAFRAMVRKEVRCPKCEAINLPEPASDTIEVDYEHEAAVCNQCGTAKPLSAFLPKEKADAAS